MSKGKWKGLDLLRKEEEPAPSTTKPAKRKGASLLREDAPQQEAPKPTPAAPKRDPRSSLGRIRTRRVMRGADGEIYDLTQPHPVWLVQIDDINAIFISDLLKSHGYDVEECPRLDNLAAKLQEAEDPPKLIVLEARAVGQQTPYFRKMVVPQLESREIPCLLTGVANEAQENSFRRWYSGPMLVGGDLDDLLEAVTDLAGVPEN